MLLDLIHNDIWEVKCSTSLQFPQSAPMSQIQSFALGKLKVVQLRSNKGPLQISALGVFTIEIYKVFIANFKVLIIKILEF
jgi:hypothetical protein